MQKMDFWNQLYTSNNCLFGECINSFLIKHYHLLSVKANVLNIGDGEGFNSIFLSQQNYRVTSLDICAAAQKKAQLNAHKAGVVFECITSDIIEWESFPNQYDMVTLFYVHVDAEHKRLLAEKIITLLKPGGLFLFENYHKDQIHTSLLGPRDRNMLYDENEIFTLYKRFENIETRVFRATGYREDLGKLPTCSLQFAGLKKNNSISFSTTE